MRTNQGMLHYRKLMNKTAVIYVEPLYVLLGKDSEIDSQHYATKHTKILDGVKWDSVPEWVAYKMAELRAEIAHLKEICPRMSLRTGQQILKRMTPHLASLCVQRAYRLRLIRQKIEVLWTLHYRYDSMRTRLQSCSGRPSVMYYYVPAKVNYDIEKGWHWIGRDDDFETLLTLLRKKNVEDASLLEIHLQPSTYAQLQMEEDLKGRSAMMDVMSSWYYRMDADVMERYCTGQDTKGPVEQDASFRCLSRASPCVASLSTAMFATYIQRLSCGMLAFRANMSSDLYNELDAKQVRSGTEFLLGGSKEICARNPDLDSDDFDPSGEVLKLLLLPRGKKEGSEERQQEYSAAVRNPRAVKMVGMGLKRLKHLLQSDLYSALEAEDLVAILYREVLTLYEMHLSEKDNTGSLNSPARSPRVSIHTPIELKLPNLPLPLHRGLYHASASRTPAIHRSQQKQY